MTYGAETLGLRMDERLLLDVLERKFLRSNCLLIMMDIGMKKEARRRFCVREKVSYREDWMVLK